MASPKIGRLDDGQWGQLQRLLSRVEQHAEYLAPPVDTRPSRSLSDWDWSNVFGIVGPRGSGKSTLLHTVYQLLSSPAQTDKDDTPAGRVHKLASKLRESQVQVVAPLDCSALPDQVDPASAVLLRVAVDPCWCAPAGAGERIGAKLSKELKRLAGMHIKGSISYRNLCVELSTTPEELPKYLIEGIEQRFDLQQRLVGWFEKAARTASVRCVVVLLDDFDLVPGPVVRRWLQALLDTLRQQRLVVILTADIERLSHVSADSKNQIDDSTGNALLLKLLPPLNRLVLEPLAHASRLSFRPRYISEPANEAAKVNDASQQGAHLDALLRDRCEGWPPWQRRLISGLVPPWPRGLVNLYELLRADKNSQSVEGPSDPSSARADQGSGMGVATSNWLSRLAICRGETLLARRLEQTTPAAWLQEMLDPAQRGEHRRRTMGHGVPGDELSNIAWQETVAAAAAASERPAPLLALPPVPVARHRRRPRDPLTHDPTWNDPLRHDFHRYDTLRDAQPEEERALWAELIVNMALAQSPSGSGAGAAEPSSESFGTRRRAVVLTRWAPLSVRSARACFRVEFSGSELARFFSSPQPHFDRGMLPWLSWDESQGLEDRYTLAIGWSVLVRHLQGAARPWPARLLSTLRVAPGNLGGELLLPRPAEGLSLLPAEVRHLVLLVDALDRCPWEALSAPRLGWAPQTYLRLAAELVRAAYVQALDRIEPLPEEVQRQHEGLLAALSHPDPGFLREGADRTSLREIDVLRMLDAAHDQGLRRVLQERHDSLARAAAAFLELKAYRTLEALPST